MARLLASTLCAIFIFTSRARADLFVAGYSTDGVPVYAQYEERTRMMLYYGGTLSESPAAGLAVGPDHSLYVSGNSFSVGHVYRMRDGLVGSPGPLPPVPDHGWTNPSAMAFGPDGNIYVTSNYNSAYAPNTTDGVLKYSRNGSFLGQIASTPAEYITFGPTGDLFVNTYDTSTSPNRIDRYRRSDGAFLGTFVNAGSGGLAGTSGITFGPDGNFYVGDRGNNRVLRYNGSTGAFIDVFVSVLVGDYRGQATSLLARMGTFT